VDQVWATDITYIPLQKGFLYLVAIMDLHSRHVLCWKLSNSLDTEFCLEALEMALFALLREWMIAQIADQDKDFDQLICDGKTLRGSAAQPDGADGATWFVTQVTLYARELGVAIAQTSFDTGESHERAALKTLLSTLELEGVLIQADALHTSPPFFSSPPSRAPTCS
jgi:transposase InsO family protein